MTANEVLCKLDKNLSNKEQEIILSDIPKEVDITRKQVAIIIHEYLKRILCEEDEKDISKALILKDLYDCRVCVNHIAQVFIKGIIAPIIGENEARDSGLPVMFGVNEPVTDTEIMIIVDRVLNIEKRL